MSTGSLFYFFLNFLPVLLHGMLDSLLRPQSCLIGLFPSSPHLSPRLKSKSLVVL